MSEDFASKVRRCRQEARPNCRLADVTPLHTDGIFGVSHEPDGAAIIWQCAPHESGFRWKLANRCQGAAKKDGDGAACNAGGNVVWHS